MNWIYSVAPAAVIAALVLRLLWWVRHHQLANQQQNSVENPTELCQTEHRAEQEIHK
jgi:hypothetical protein